MPTLLTLRTTRRDGSVELIAEGEIDLSNIGEFKAAIDSVLAENAGSSGQLVVDMAAVEYVDSAAINVLSAAADDIRSLIVHPMLMSTFTVSGLTELIAIEPGAG